MNDGHFTHQIAEHNPLSINIEFNINNPRGNVPQLNQIIRGKKLQAQTLNLKGHQCGCQGNKTPQLAQTDRNTYSKQMGHLKQTEERKKKSKRNSMDMNLDNKSNGTDFGSKGKIMAKGQTVSVLKKNQPMLKQDSFKKKRTFSKNEVEAFKKTFVEPKETKSLAIDNRSEKKTNFHKSLKNIIHKIVNSQLSRRSLLGSSANKGKSPYYTHNLSGLNVTSRKKNQTKKKNLSCKSERQIQRSVYDGAEFREQIVEKLNSLKSMTNSILKSEIEEFEMPYYSKKKGKIHIKTDQSIDHIDQIAFYQKKSRREQKREAINKNAINETNKLIQTYIQLINQEESEQQLVEQQEYKPPKKHHLIEKSHEDIDVEDKREIPENHKQIRDILAKEYKNLFHERNDEITEEIGRHTITSIKHQLDQQQGDKKEPFPIQSNHEEKLRPFMSSEINRPNISSQMQRLKLQQLKKQEIQKWGYLLEFIKKNMNSDESDTETVLNQVYWFLQRSKNDLQRDLNSQLSNQKPSQREIDEFTVKYSDKKDQNQAHKDYYQEKKKIQDEIDEDVASFKEQYTEQNQDLKMLNLETISNALRDRQTSLYKKQTKELNILEDKRQSGKIGQQQYLIEVKKTEKWIKKELTQISKAKKNIWKGYHQAKGILDKTVSSRYYEKHQSSATKKMMKCLSETYLKRPHVDYKQLLKGEVEKKQSYTSSEAKQRLSNEQSQSESSSSKIQDKYHIKSNEKLDPISKLKREQQEQQYSEQFQEDLQNNMQKSDKMNPFGEKLANQSNELQLENPLKSDEMNRSQQMQQIKQRLLRMKREHYGFQQTNEESNINYQQIQKQLDEQYSDEQISIINKEIGSTFIKNKPKPENKFDLLQNKLKYCCNQDKQDIFEFIFLDLCIELYQEPCKDNKIMKGINLYVNKVKNQAKRKKGVKTNLNVVKQYLKRFISFLLRTSKQCLNSINVPMGPTALQMLRYMHDSDYDIRQEDEQVPTLIIPINVFDKFQQSLLPTLEFQEYYEEPEKEQARINFLKTILHIHNKALFDSLNEFLDHQRPFGIWGKPFPWKRCSNFQHEFSQTNKEQKLKRSMEKVIEQCSYVCGLLVDKQQSLVGNAKISEAYVQQIRQDRLSRMLANELVESEQRWLFYDDEQTQVLVQIETYVWNFLIHDFRVEVSILQHRLLS